MNNSGNESVSKSISESSNLNKNKFFIPNQNIKFKPNNNHK